MKSELLDTMPPNNPDAEKGLIGSVLLQPSLLDEIDLDAEEFYTAAHDVIWRRANSLWRQHGALDTMLLLQAIKAEGDKLAGDGAWAACLAECARSVPYAANAAYYAAIVRSEAIRRRIREACEEAFVWVHDPTRKPLDVLAAVEASLSRIGSETNKADLHRTSDVVHEAMARIDQVCERKESLGVPTGLFKIDRSFGGLFPSELTMLAARPGVGKSSLAMQIAFHNGQRGRNIYVASLEMSRAELVTRQLCAEAGVNNRVIRSGSLTEGDRAKLAEACGEVAAATIWFHDRSGLTTADITRAVRRLKRNGLALVVIDYLQLLDSVKDGGTKAGNREQEVARMSKALKALARDQDVPVLCLCQLNRALDKDGVPRLANLRESGAIEQDADVVWFLHRPDAESTETKLIIAKNRNGETGHVALDWQASATRFSDPMVATHAAFDQFATNEEF